MNKEKKRLIISIATIGLCVIFVWSYFSGQNEKISTHNVDVSKAAKATKTKSNIEPINKIKIADPIKEKLEEKLEESNVKTEEDLGSPIHQIGDSDEDEEIEVIAYTSPLPPNPDPETVKYYFIDVNSNGVRDDVEIEIVEEFGDDKNVVESFFAGTRVYERNMWLVDSNFLSKENIQIILDDGVVETSCQILYFKQSEFYEGEEFISDSSYGKFVKELYANYYNTEERISKAEKAWNSTHGYISIPFVASEEGCQEFFLYTKTLTSSSY